ncbi:DNA mismatch repair protein MutS [Paenibacillus beijingensis]|uniref:DNA mismatch repair protein MutS n=1 Tax=Paenibacillus beijingensis TaxID=1126833 RepID=A0A0D5NP82_9BACL|nr:DNA mismatch repair protein MutS [Paenibacillus beijingensis]AJY77091.1 DNA mismatch repair protein MutS [Paenibacillus beijingensis]
MASYTPMIEQYLAVKEEAKDAFLFFRLGDFYELFFQDAVLAARELDITLTGRAGGAEEKIPMCGVPYHSADNYIARLIEKGYKVAICEQVEDPAAAKGVVRREIVRVVTPGTVMESKSLTDEANNFIVSAAAEGASYAIAACDLTTGELYVTSCEESFDPLVDELGVYHPAEIVTEAAMTEQLRNRTASWNRLVLLSERAPMDKDRLEAHFSEDQLSGLAAIRVKAVALLLAYLDETQKRSLAHVRSVRSYEPSHYLVLDPFTRRNLELTETVQSRSKKGSLLWLLDKTETSMGARLLRRWIDKPLLSRDPVEKRLEAVDKLCSDLILREDVRRELDGIYDLERLVGRVAFGSANGRDLNALKQSLRHVPALRELCAVSGSATLAALVARIDDCRDLADTIETVVIDDPPVSVRDGGLIRSGYDEYLDRLRGASTDGKKWLADLERREREATGIKSLKIGYNKVFGYFLEVSKANLSLLPEGRYERKQTLANAERFVTPELKEKERLILEAEEKMVDVEYRIFMELRDHLASQLHRLQKLAEMIATLDALQSLATVSAERRYVKPQLTDGYDLIVEQGRHPVVEAVMEGKPFIANGTALTAEEASMLLITGPNMAGKSTYMRQVALICIMAQIGCFVPAKSAVVPLLDRIFTRIGAADDLIGGQSTFMVEMKDIQIMTSKATPRSLVIIDELGRGTSTAEGMSIAQAVIEYVHHRIGCKALVSTHFHELAHLEETLPKLRNACMAVRESDGDVTFLRRLVPGAASTSYGIYCARLAGLPERIIDRAYELLEDANAGHASDAAIDEAEGTDGETAARKQPAYAGAASGALLQGSAAREASAAAEDAATAASGKSGSHDAYEPGYSRDPQLAQAIAADRTAATETSAIKETAAGPESYAMKETAAAAGAERSGEIVQLSIFDDPALTELSVSKRRGSAKAEQLAEGLRKLDLLNMTPLQAIQWLSDMKSKLAE